MLPFPKLKTPLLSVFLFFMTMTPAWALDQIIRPYFSVRSVGMGGVRLTTGLYDENFFFNPARVTANPESKFTLLSLSAESTGTTVSDASKLTGSGNALQAISGVAGDNLSTRVQLVVPAYYLASNETRKWALGIGLIMSVQGDGIIRKSYSMNFGALVDAGPAITFGRKFLENDALSVGVTGHLMARLSTNPNYSLLDYVKGTSLTINSIGGAGGTYDFDLGATYLITQWGSWNFSVAGAIQNVLGDDYSRIKIHPGTITALPVGQPRSYGLGVSLDTKELVFFHDTIVALELTDVLNNRDGSFFRMVHLGGETHWKSFIFRLGVNQGYLTAGFGMNFHYLTLDASTYGEELGLNSGTFEDRRFALNLGLHI